MIIRPRRASAASLGAQPVDSDLTAISALSTTAFGRALLTNADAAALLAAAGGQASDADLAAIAALTTTGYGRSVLALADQAALVALLPSYQPADADLSSFAAITPGAYAATLLGVSNQAALTALIAAATASLSGAMSAADKTAFDRALPQVTHATTQTTDATVTTTTALPLATGKTGFSIAVVTALKDDGLVGAAFMYVCAARNNGTAIIIGSALPVVTPPADAGAATWAVVMSVAAPNVRVRVAGQAATTINWSTTQIMWT